MSFNNAPAPTVLAALAFPQRRNTPLIHVPTAFVNTRNDVTFKNNVSAVQCLTPARAGGLLHAPRGDERKS
jgi:hypothetical protein